MLLSSICSVLTLFVVSTIAVTVVAMDNGWPKVSIMKMGARQMANCLATIFGSYFVLLFISCVFYLLILWNRSRLGKSSVGLVEVQEIWTGSRLEAQTAGLRATGDQGAAVSDNGTTLSVEEPEESPDDVATHPELTGAGSRIGNGQTEILDSVAVWVEHQSREDKLLGSA